MTSGAESTKATETAWHAPEQQTASDEAVGTETGAVTFDNELKSRIVPAPRSGQVHRTRLRFGTHLESDQGNPIPDNSAKTHCVAVFEHPRDAESATRELQGAGFDMKRVSLVARDDDAEEHTWGPNAARNAPQCWATEGTFWGGMLGALCWPAFFFIPGIGPVLTAGLIGSTLIVTIKAATVGLVAGGTTSALVAALSSWGLSKDVVAGYEEDLKSRRLLLIASGSTAELVGVHPIFAGRAAKVNVHSR